MSMDGKGGGPDRGLCKVVDYKSSGMTHSLMSPPKEESNSAVILRVQIQVKDTSPSTSGGKAYTR
jgi:hypothetical protein